MFRSFGIEGKLQYVGSSACEFNCRLVWLDSLSHERNQPNAASGTNLLREPGLPETNNHIPIRPLPIKMT